MLLRKFLVISFSGVLMAACSSDNKAVAKIPPLDPANLDTTCAPCEDFYTFANGGWIANNPIPEEYAQWGSFLELRDRSLEILHKILDSLSENQSSVSDPAMQKLGSLYASCMDTDAIESAGLDAVADDLEKIDVLASSNDARSYLAQAHAAGLETLFTFGSAQDAKKSTDVIFALAQGGLGLPDRDYYLKTDSASSQIRDDYVRHISNIFVLAGQTREEADEDAKKIMELETTLANNSMSRVDRRDPVLTYNKKTVAELQTMAPGFDWKSYFEVVGVPEGSSTNVYQPKFMSSVDGLLNSVPLDTWKAYFRWNILRDASPRLTKAFVDENFDFYSRKLTGAKEPLPRYKVCVQMADAMMGEALGQAYVTEHFPPEAKSRALEMVENIKEAFRERLATRPWMSEKTREEAYRKLATFNVKIGYPDKWTDYSDLEITPEQSYYSAYASARSFATALDIAKVGKPVDRDYWWMTPPTVNAYYSATMNEIVFPAGILQPPFFDPEADDAVNYGGMGAVIGHEISHGFDDKGSKFDEAGNLRDWFTAEDLSNFKSRTKIVEDQFNNYTILDSLPVNGALTLGENIADLGGVTIAYQALQNVFAKNGRPEPIDGFTPEQRFFLAWAQIWRGSIRDEMARMRIKTDTHSPQIWRTNGPLSMLDSFHEAWGCKEGDPMVRETDKRADIW